MKNMEERINTIEQYKLKQLNEKIRMIEDEKLKKGDKIISDLSKELNNIKEKNLNTKVMPLKFCNGWKNLGPGFELGKIIKKGNEITLSGVITGTNFSTVCILPIDCRPKGELIFNINNHDILLRFDVCPNGEVIYCAGNHISNWISLDGIHFFTAIILKKL